LQGWNLIKHEKYLDEDNIDRIMLMANNFLTKLNLYIKIQKHIEHSHIYGTHSITSRCDYTHKSIKHKFGRKSVEKTHWCVNKCVLENERFNPFSLKNMSAFVYMTTLKKHHDPDVEKSSMITSISAATAFFKMNSKPIQQLCACVRCKPQIAIDRDSMYVYDHALRYSIILDPQCSSLCRNFETYEYLRIHYPHTLPSKLKNEFDKINYLKNVGKFIMNTDFKPHPLGYLPGYEWSF